MAVTPDSRCSAADQLLEEKQRIAAEVRGPIATGRWAWEWIRSFLIAFGLFLLIRTFLVEAFRIPTGSMETTLLAGDFLLVNKAVYGVAVPFTRLRSPAYNEPQRGDIVIFVPPHEDGRNYVKRLVGLPGDTLEMHSKTLYVNGSAHREPYARFSERADVYAAAMFWQCDFVPATINTSECRPTRDNWGPIVVPEQHYFMLGDNRDDSEDSRYWGFVPRQAIKGQPLVLYYSFDPASRRPLPWLTSIRWRRIGRMVH